jgi:hypothetical protein
MRASHHRPFGAFEILFSERSVVQATGMAESVCQRDGAAGPDAQVGSRAA